MQINIDTETIKRKVEENPVLAAVAVGSILTGVSKLMNANTARRNSKTYALEVARRISK